DDVFKSWQHKKLNHELISEKDLLLLLWTPLMSGQQSKFETLIKAANFLDEAPPQYDEKKDHLKSVLLLFADKFLSNIEIKKFKEVSSMAGFI
ncbi:MAG TPA: hypothetical protein DCY20_03205, partial [Firmicutes bacterium]|nr:hypothetical protein [Bacillota bacterium]